MQNRRPVLLQKSLNQVRLSERVLQIQALRFQESVRFYLLLPLLQPFCRVRPLLFLHKQELKDNEREFIIAKNKEGECGSTKLYFDGPTQHFSYIGKGDKPLKGVDYGSFRAVAQSDDGGYEQMPMDTDVPFDSTVPSAC